MPIETALAQINFNDEVLSELAKNYLKEYFEQRLAVEWYTRSDIKAITQMKSDAWIRDHVDNDPYVKDNGLMFYVSDGKKFIPRYHVEIRDFLKKFNRKETAR